MVELKIVRIAAAVLLFLLLLPLSSLAEKEQTDPVKNREKKWRIGYIEAGTSSDDYEKSLRGLIEGLMQLGWIEHSFVPENQKTDELWMWLSRLGEKSAYIEFVADAYKKSGGDEDADKREKNKRAVIERLNQKKDIDMMIAMGTYAGKDMANDLHSTNTMIMEASNPVPDIVQSESYSGRPYIHAKVEPARYKDQISFFYSKFKFKNLGVVYIDTANGRSFAALDYIHEIEKSLKFTPVLCPIRGDLPKENLVQSIRKCHEELAPKIDAMYLTSHLVGTKEEDMKNMQILLQPMLERKIPTWSQAGKMEVEYGALMSFTRPDYADVGYFHAKVMAQILRGVQPGKISQKFVDPKGEATALNLKTAQLIQYNPDWEVLASAEYVYENIKNASAGENQGRISK
jgi:hypothetical protein